MLYNIILPIDHFPTGGGEWVADRISSLDDDSLLANSVRAHERFREACERTHTTQLTRRLADLKLMSTSGLTTNKDGHHPPLEPGVVEDAPCSARAWFSARKDISLTDNIFLSGIDKMVFGKIDTNIEPIDDSSFRDPDKLIESLGDAPSVPDVQMRDVSDVVMRGVDGVMMCVTDVIPWHQPGRHQLGVCAALMMSAPTGNFLWGAWYTRVPMKRRNAHLVYPGAAVHDRVPGIPGNLVLPRTPSASSRRTRGPSQCRWRSQISSRRAPGGRKMRREGWGAQGARR